MNKLTKLQRPTRANDCRVVVEYDPNSVRPATLHNIFTDWKKSHRWKHKTQEQHFSFVSQFLTWCDWEDSALTPQGMIDYRNHLLEQGHKESYSDRKMRVVRQFLNYRQSVTNIPNPLRKVNGRMFTFNYNHTKENIITEEQFEKLKNCDIPLIPWMAIAGYRTGHRLGDICLMNWNQVDFKGRIIKFAPMKTLRHGIQADVPIITDLTRPESDLHQMLVKLKTEHDARVAADDNDWPSIGQNFVCPELAIRYIATQNGATEYFKGACKKLGLEGKHFHCLRHSVATMLSNSPVNTLTSMRILGLRRVKTLQAYVRDEPKHLAAAFCSANDYRRARNAEATDHEINRAPAGGEPISVAGGEPDSPIDIFIRGQSASSEARCAD